MAKRPCSPKSEPIEIASSCESPVNVNLCNAIGIETALTEVGCVVVAGVVTGKVLACKTTSEDGLTETLKLVAMYFDGTQDSDYTGSWQVCGKDQVLLLEGCIPDVANPGDTEIAVVGLNAFDGSLAWGPISTATYGFVSCCPDELVACINMEGYDYYALADYTAGQTTPFEVLVDGVSQGVLALDYTVESDGTGKGSWYAQVNALINAATGWTVTLVTNAAENGNGRPVWQFDYSGSGASTLVITENNDTRTIAVDAAGVITGVADDGGNPFGTDPFTACA